MFCENAFCWEKDPGGTLGQVNLACKKKNAEIYRVSAVVSEGIHVEMWLYGLDTLQWMEYKKKITPQHN